MSRRSQAFTLAEVLIALALLGVIAAFAIPKVMESVGETQKKAIFREGVGEISKLATEAYLNGTWPKVREDADAYLQAKLNAEKLIVQNGLHYLDTGDGLRNYYYILRNGSTVRYKHSVNSQHYQFNIDWNGPPSNGLEDNIMFFINLDPVAWCGINPGGVRPPDPTVPGCDQFTGAEETNQEVYDRFMKMVVN